MDPRGHSASSAQLSLTAASSFQFKVAVASVPDHRQSYVLLYGKNRASSPAQGARFLGILDGVEGSRLRVNPGLPGSLSFLNRKNCVKPPRQNPTPSVKCEGYLSALNPQYWALNPEPPHNALEVPILRSKEFALALWR